MIVLGHRFGRLVDHEVKVQDATNRSQRETGRRREQVLYTRKYNSRLQKNKDKCNNLKIITHGIAAVQEDSMTHARVLHHIISRLMTVVVCVLLMIFKLEK